MTAIANIGAIPVKARSQLTGIKNGTFFVKLLRYIISLIGNQCENPFCEVIEEDESFVE
jgi:hypothetical protein